MKNDIIIYNTEDGNSRVELHLLDGTIWLNQLEIAELFQTTKQNISKHIKAIFDDGELDKNAVVNYQLTTANDGKDYNTAFYNLDMILAIGYRVRSPRGMQFRNYASTVLKDYLIKGFTMDDERLKENSDEAKYFFATVQNKMHYAIHHNTASELVYNRVNSEKDFMGLKTFKGELPTLKEAKIAKNYLNEKELKNLNNLVSGYLEFAERQAEKEIVMYMKDWVEHIDKILKAVGEDILQGNGKITNQEMSEKVEIEYKKFREKNLTQVEKDYLEEIKNIERIAKENSKKK